ncbi:MAG: cysteine peptidase family C39 domain-containing protein [Bryobacteraceae bacterium]|nr:cysteine peptidase family C39 domain-containing protein [Bryobacteraceae bacterium]
MLLPAILALAVLDVPFVAQEKNACGAASIAMVMQYWGRPADAPAIHRELYSPGARGVYADALAQRLRRAGFDTHAFRGEWKDLEHHLDKGRPLIVALETAGGRLHYVVVVGVDTARGLLLAHDPAVRRSLAHHRAAFEKQWKGANHWTLLAVPSSP